MTVLCFWPLRRSFTKRPVCRGGVLIIGQDATEYGSPASNLPSLSHASQLANLGLCRVSQRIIFGLELLTPNSRKQDRVFCRSMNEDSPISKED